MGLSLYWHSRELKSYRYLKYADIHATREEKETEKMSSFASLSILKSFLRKKFEICCDEETWEFVNKISIDNWTQKVSFPNPFIWKRMIISLCSSCTSAVAKHGQKVFFSRRGHFLQFLLTYFSSFFSGVVWGTVLISINQRDKFVRQFYLSNLHVFNSSSLLPYEADIDDGAVLVQGGWLGSFIFNTSQSVLSSS